MYDWLEGGAAEVQVPSGAVTDTITLGLTEITTATAPGDLVFGGESFRIETYRDGQPVPSSSLQGAITVTLTYAFADVAGVDVESLDVRYWDGTQWSTEGITIVSRDPAKNQIVVKLEHLSDFALFGEPQARARLPIVLRIR